MIIIAVARVRNAWCAHFSEKGCLPLGANQRKRDFHQTHSRSLICIKGHRRLTHKSPEKCPQVELIENVTRFDLMDQFTGPYRLPIFSHFPISSFICDRQMERKKKGENEN